MIDYEQGDGIVLPILEEINSGDGLSLAQAGKRFPAHRGQGALNPSTVFRWVTNGVRTKDGRSVKLEAILVGGRWLTSRAAVSRFIATLTNAAIQSPITSVASVRSPGHRERTSHQAAALLESSGA
jgi:hypothetical protein